MVARFFTKTEMKRINGRYRSTKRQNSRNPKPAIFVGMEGLMEQIATYRKEIEAYEIANPQQLEEYRIKFLGTKGILKSLFGEMKNVPA